MDCADAVLASSAAAAEIKEKQCIATKRKANDRENEVSFQDGWLQDMIGRSLLFIDVAQENSTQPRAYITTQTHEVAESVCPYTRS